MRAFALRARYRSSPQPVPDLPPRTGNFSQTGTLGDLIDRLFPARLSLFHGLQRGIPGFGLNVILGHRKLYGLTRTRQRSRCLEVGNRLSRNLTALAGFAIAGKIGVRLSGPFILKNRRDVYYAAASIVGHASSNLS